MDVLRTVHSAVNGVECYAEATNDALQTMCCATVRDVIERSVTAMRTIRLSLREVMHGGGCDRPRRFIVPSCIKRSNIRITVAWFRPTRLLIYLKDNPQSR
ncbi:uncharacterized protein TNCV_3875871 [Trichonephila clavipes]|uniref:Uncharacterized protein n=1 Tax=Trichonephila clavipes TaxID=2585209 RepID=A0A8X6SRY5_TRICX|nr:uncharacterized protein TNCV_3875871 [Trichonephila clavipes]